MAQQVSPLTITDGVLPEGQSLEGVEEDEEGNTTRRPMRRRITMMIRRKGKSMR